MQNNGDKPRRHFHLAWLLLIAVPGYVMGGMASRGQSWPACINILFHVSLLIGAICSIPLGISYGEQDKDYWM